MTEVARAREHDRMQILVNTHPITKQVNAGSGVQSCTYDVERAEIHKLCSSAALALVLHSPAQNSWMARE